MPFELSHEHKIVRKITQEFTKREVIPYREKLLKEDEETIVNIIKQRDGKRCEQGTLRVITGIPKSSLSKLLSELESRGIIYREKRGKKNIVFLK